MKKLGEIVDAYCAKCGKKLVVSSIYSVGFDTVTGKERFVIGVRCPNKTWVEDFFSMFVSRHHSTGILYGRKYDMVSFNL